jgi:nitrite reductase/ring-hydroxylating ferredoxin subunit
MPEPIAPVRICAGAALEDGGLGVRFSVEVRGRAVGGFVVRYAGVVYGYLNQCAHVPMEMDWQEGQFFESSGLYLMCATLGAIYEPDTGRCVGGPCRGAHLSKLEVAERDGEVWWQPDALFRMPVLLSPVPPTAS